MFIDSICPDCGHINHVEVKGEGVHMMSIECENKGCHKRVYDHVVIPFSRILPIKDQRRAKLEDMIVDKKFHHMSEKSVICLLIFENGYEIEGRATVRNLDDFRLVIGKDKAYEQALKKAMIALGAYLV
jgi:hypothetical protein